TKKFTIKSWRNLIVTNEDGSGERYFESDGVKAVHAKKEWLPAPKPRKLANVPGPSQASAGEELSFPIADANGPQTIGFSPNENFMSFGRRVNTYAAYIKPVEESYKKTLTVRRYSVVSKVLLREILPEDLEAAKVKPLVVLPQVGNNLQDHIVVRVEPFTVTDQHYTWSLQRNLSFSDLDQLLYEGKGYAIITPNGFSYITSQRAKRENPNWPDLQIIFRFHRPNDPFLGCDAALGRPYSQGTLRFNSSAIGFEDNNLPISDPQYFTHPNDVDAIIEVIEFCFKVFEGTQAFKNIGVKFVDKPIEECKDMVFRSKDYWTCYIQHRTMSMWHASGTCRMGKLNDRDGSVVDSKLRVHGVRKLRIIDASIIPRITNANIAAPIPAIAEKIAANMIEEYSSCSF
ncbi:unnamed protein product, partial [Allacma fusca]